MDIFRSLQYPSRNPGWFGKLIAWEALMLGIVTTPLAIGYFIRLVRNIARGNEALPSYADKQQLYWDGLRCLGVRCLLSLPLLLAFIALVIACGLMDESTEAARIMSQLGTRYMGNMFRSLYLFIFVFIAPLTTLCIAYSSSWYAGINFSLMGKLLRDNIFNYLFTVLVGYAVYSMSGFGLFAVVVGFLFTLPYAAFAVAHLYGSFLRECLLSNGEEELPG